MPTILAAQGQRKYNIDTEQSQSSADKVREFYRENKAIMNANKDWHKKHKDRRQVNRITKKHTKSIQTKEVNKRMKDNEKKSNRNNTGKMSISDWFKKKSFDRQRKK